MGSRAFDIDCIVDAWVAVAVANGVTIERWAELLQYTTNPSPKDWVQIYWVEHM